MKNHVEDSELMVILDWAQWNPVASKFLIHIENERKCTWAQGIRRKRKGIKKGVSDLFLAYPSRGFHGMWVELKGPKGLKNYRPAPVTDQQKEWLGHMTYNEYYAIVCYGADEAIKEICWYLSN